MKFFRRIGNLVGPALLLLALPTKVNEGVAGWSSWLRWVARQDARWLFAIVGLAIVVGANLPALLRRRTTPQPVQVVTRHTGYQDRQDDGRSNWIAEHEVVIDEHGTWVRLWVRSTDASELGGIRCKVQDPDGDIADSMYEPPLVGGYRPDRVGRKEFGYPHQFYRTKDPLPPGKYLVRWVIGSNDTLLKRDDFTLPG